MAYDSDNDEYAADIVRRAHKREPKQRSNLPKICRWIVGIVATYFIVKWIFYLATPVEAQDFGLGQWKVAVVADDGLGFYHGGAVLICVEAFLKPKKKPAEPPQVSAAPVADTGKVRTKPIRAKVLPDEPLTYVYKNGELPFVSRPKDQIPVLVLACNRPTVTRCLDSLLKYSFDNSEALTMSQDCEHAETELAIKEYSDAVIYMRQPNRTRPETQNGHEDYVNYYKIARHYKWAFNQLFHVFKYEQLIVIEDDMEVAPDFFQYFEAFLPVLKSDPTLFCVSAWNDNGKLDNVEESLIFQRSDFFPGLGWMLLESFWDEISPKWPQTYWDDWLRHPSQRKNRACIRPEVSRTMNFGRVGVSGGQYFDDHISKIVLNKELVEFHGFDEEVGSFKPYKELPLFHDTVATKPIPLLHVVDVRLFLKDNFDAFFLRQVYDLSTKTYSSLIAELIRSDDPYQFKEYTENANLLSFAKTKSRIEAASETSKAATVYDNVSSPYFCGRNCRRRFLITYDRGGPGNWGLQGQTTFLAQWRLMTDIREDCARTAYLEIVSFKARLQNPQPLYPPSIDGKNDEREEFVQIFIAPDTRPVLAQ